MYWPMDNVICSDRFAPKNVLTESLYYISLLWAHRKTANEALAFRIVLV